MEPGDRRDEGSEEAALVGDAQAGDSEAFARLIRVHGPSVAALLRFRVDRVEDAEDLFQETLLAAWAGIGRLRDPGRFRAWVLEIARNRCRDWYRSSGRREHPTEPLVLADQIDRLAVPGADSRRRTGEVLDALERISIPQRGALKVFYLEGRSIAEIAAHEGCPTGTVKRRLSEGRAAIRRELGVTPHSTKRRGTMSDRLHDAPSQDSIPSQRPAVAVHPLLGGPRQVVTSELRWWVVRPEPGQRALQALYSADGEVQSITELKVTRPAVIHGEQGVEIATMTRWFSGPDWQPASLLYARLTENELQYLAVRNDSSDPDEPVLLQTFLDTDFDGAWGRMARLLEDRGDWSEDAGGVIRRRSGFDGLSASGCGSCEVEIGGRRFRCLRLLQLEGPVDNPSSPLIEGFVEESGRIVLVRYYCHPGLDGTTTNPDSAVQVEGYRFEHWEDLLTGFAIGV